MSGLRILIMEDEAIIAMLLQEVLEGMGHDVCAVAASEAEGVTAAKHCRPNLIVADARLREGSGISAIREILRDGFVPHVFVSGDVATVRKLSKDVIVLEKPFTEAELSQAIDRAVMLGGPT